MRSLIYLSRDRSQLRILLLAVILCGFGFAGFTAAADSAEENHARLRLISEESSFEPGQLLWVGVLFDVDPGWHVYWQNPGDSGLPPRIRWTVPPGFRAGQLRWPRPFRLGKGSVIDYGYEDQLLLMVPVSVPAKAKGPATIAVDVAYLVCGEICVPGKAQMSISIQPSADRFAHFSRWHKVFQSTRGQFPKPAPATWRISAQSDKNEFELVVDGAAPKQNMRFFPLDPGVIDNPAPQTLSFANGGFALALRKSDLLTKPVSVLRGVLDVPGVGVFDIAAPVAGQ